MGIDRWGAVSVTGTYRSAGVKIGAGALPDPLANATSGFVYRAGPDLAPFWAAGFTTALTGTLLQGWSVTADPVTGRVAAAGTYRGVINFGDGNPVRSDLDGGAYNVWVVERRP